MKTYKKKKSYRSISFRNININIFNKILANEIHEYIKLILYHDEVALITVMQGWFNIQHAITVFYYINRLDKKNYII